MITSDFEVTEISRISDDVLQLYLKYIDKFELLNDAERAAYVNLFELLAKPKIVSVSGA